MGRLRHRPHADADGRAGDAARRPRARRPRRQHLARQRWACYERHAGATCGRDHRTTRRTRADAGRRTPQAGTTGAWRASTRTAPRGTVRLITGEACAAHLAVSIKETLLMKVIVDVKTFAAIGVGVIGSGW